MGQIRITGGIHRSRKITVEDQPGLRPTADRVRETLFNWLGQNLSGMTVLDLYAGSGILGFEAASRHATSVTCVDNNPRTIKQLYYNVDVLNLSQINIKLQTAETFIESSDQTYDLIFLDPPFDSNELNAISGIIGPLVNPDGLIYREYGTSQDINPLDDEIYTLIKHKKVGQVSFELWQLKT